jgi:hypothetical protein
LLGIVSLYWYAEIPFGRLDFVMFLNFFSTQFPNQRIRHFSMPGSIFRLYLMTFLFVIVPREIEVAGIRNMFAQAMDLFHVE